MSDWTSLPLFPLNTVLFPGMVLPLHIFEERYKQMIGRCLEEKRSFGVLLIRSGSEVGVPAVPYEVGTTAVIAGARHLDDGRIHIITVGRTRFRLQAVKTETPYLVGDAEAWPLSGSSSAHARAQIEPLRARFQEYLGLLEEAQGESIELDGLPSEPRSLALMVARTMRIPALDKQRLLNQPDVTEMLKAERYFLARERAILEQIARSQGDQWEGGHSGLLARN
jgi:Lon protease-like protein